MDAGAIASGWVDTRDGRKLFLQRLGAGQPVVVFEAAMGASRNMWGAVLEHLDGRVDAVVYDRSGLGRSPVDAQRRDLDRMSGDLLDLLRAVDDGPYVLVAHSWGGPIVRHAAAQIPEQVAGIVLVDVTEERFDLVHTPEYAKRSERYARMLAPMARLGVGHLIARRMARSLPEPWARAMRTEEGTAVALATMRAELLESTDDLRRLRDDPPLLPDVAVTLISGRKSSRLEGGQRDALLEAHADAVRQWPKGRHVFAEHSGHTVPFTEPELVAEEILRVVGSIDAGSAAD